MTRDHIFQPSWLLPVSLLGEAAITETNEAPANPEVEVALGDPGRPATVPTLLIALSDDSGSVTAFGGSDPLSNRYAEMNRAFATVAKRGSRRELGAVLHFDTPCSTDVEPTPITSWNASRLKRGLQVASDGAGSSELLPSLRRAMELAQNRPGHEVTLVVLSDFALLDADVDQALTELAAFPGDVHAVVLGNYIREDTFDACITVTHIGRNDPPGAVARALFRSLVAHRPGSRPTSSPGSVS